MGGTLPGLDDCGAHLVNDGVRFCVWAPFAEKVAVTGDFNNWAEDGLALSKGSDGCWYADVQHAVAGQEYKYLITHDGKVLQRNNPRALQLSPSGDSSVIVDPSFDWGDDTYELPPHDRVVLYEMHVGTFVRPDPATPGTFRDAITKLDYLVELGVNVVEVMPCNAMWMDRWWGYTPDNIYAVHSAYGGRHGFMEFVKAAHQRGLGVVLDVVYNHLSRDAGLDLWQFDGWHEGEDGGGIYFYNDARVNTPWGGPRPDYGRPEVRRYITDNARMWLRDCHVDGLRVDSTVFLRNVEGKNNDPAHDLADGWKLLQELTAAAHEEKPHSLMIAEDLQGNAWITKPASEGGAGFMAQWDPSVAGILREQLDPAEDSARNLAKLHDLLENRTNDNPLERIIYSESHDTDAAGNGGSRLDESVAPGDAGSLHARRMSSLAAGLLMTAPGIPMLFQGQEFEEGGAFTHYAALDWDKAKEFTGILQLYKHLIDLRLNVHGNTAGLRGPHVELFLTDDKAKVAAFRRWSQGGPRDDVVAVVNMSGQKLDGYEVAFPAEGIWWTRFNADWQGYGEGLTNIELPKVEAIKTGGQVRARLTIPPYGFLIFSQD